MVLRRLSVSFAALLFGCGGPAAPSSPSPAAPAPSASSFSSPAPVSSSSAAGAGSPKKARANVPPYARLDLVDSAYPERARLIRAGRFAISWPEKDNDDPTKPVDWAPPVVDAATDKVPMRVLCRDPDVQIAAYPETPWFAPVAREPVVLHPNTTRPNGAEASDKEPGVRVWKGARLTVLGSAANVDHVRFESLGLTGEGYAQRVRIGLSYVTGTDAGQPAAPTTERFDAELARETATLLPEPKKAARPIATLSPYPENQASHRFQKLGPRKDGFALVRLLHPETSVVGWIEEAALKSTTGQLSWEKEQRPGLGQLRGSKMITVKRGQLLVNDNGEPVGIFLTDHDTPCINRCDTEAPRVAVRACGGTARAIVER